MSILLLCACFSSFLVPNDSLINKRIVNGIATSASDYPFIASLIRYYPKSGASSFSFCGGSLFRKQYPVTVITAAHCLANLNGALQVDLHRSDIDASHSILNNYSRYNTLGYIIHSDYNDTMIDNDIALIFLDADLTDESHLDTVSIPDLNNNDASECCGINDELKVIGYGADYEGGGYTDTLEYSNKQFVDRYDCNHMLTQYVINTYYNGIIEYTDDTEWVWSYVTDNMICAIGENTDSCQGDSGGPIIKNSHDIIEQVGIVSWGFGCNNGVPGVYTNIGVYRSWIYDQIDAYIENPQTPSQTIFNDRPSSTAIFYDITFSVCIISFSAVFFV